LHRCGFRCREWISINRHWISYILVDFDFQTHRFSTVPFGVLWWSAVFRRTARNCMELSLESESSIIRPTMIRIFQDTNSPGSGMRNMCLDLDNNRQTPDGYERCYTHGRTCAHFHCKVLHGWPCANPNPNSTAGPTKHCIDRISPYIRWIKLTSRLLSVPDPGSKSFW